MCIICDRLRNVDKRAELNCLVNHLNPHIILGQESRLGQDIPCCEVFPKGLRYFRWGSSHGRWWRLHPGQR